MAACETETKTHSGFALLTTAVKLGQGTAVGHSRRAINIISHKPQTLFMGTFLLLLE